MSRTWNMARLWILNSSEERQLMQASQSLLLKVRRNSLSSNDFMAEMSPIHLYCLHNLREKLCLSFINCSSGVRTKAGEKRDISCIPSWQMYHEQSTFNYSSINDWSWRGMRIYSNYKNIRILYIYNSLWIYIINVCILFII